MSSADGARAPRRALRVSAYSGEHGVYGVVLTTAMLAIGWDQDNDLEVIAFVLGTVFIFWLAHLYAAVVASRATEEGRERPMWEAVRVAAVHSRGMLIATLIPVAILLLGGIGLIGEWFAYWLALASGVLTLGAIGYANSARNQGTVFQRIMGVIVTMSLGAVVIGLSILVH